MFWNRDKRLKKTSFESVKPTSLWMKGVVTGEVGVHGIPYQYVNWAFEYSGKEPCIPDSNCFYKPEYVYVLYSACLKYLEEADE